MGILRFPEQRMHCRDSLVDDKVTKVTISKRKYDHKGTVLKAIFLVDATRYDKL